ncbi:MAG: hypothetical protein R6T92_08215 [Desulfosalsimonadaceae bacterium]
MKKGIAGCLLVIALIGFHLLAGCAGYGSARYRQHDPGLLNQMIADFDNYHVFYSGMSEAFPSGLIFDPTGDGNIIVREGWVNVENRALAEKLVRNLEGYQDYPARLYSLIGEDGQMYGYLYTAYPQNHIVVRQVAEGRIRVLEMHEAPHLKYDPNGDYLSGALRQRQAFRVQGPGEKVIGEDPADLIPVRRQKM